MAFQFSTCYNAYTFVSLHDLWSRVSVCLETLHSSFGFLYIVKLHHFCLLSLIDT